MERKNCWQVKVCGRQPGGDNVEAIGACPAAVPNEFDGVNQGERAGRFCWAVVGTLCDEAAELYPVRVLTGSSRGARSGLQTSTQRCKRRRAAEGITHGAPDSPLGGLQVTCTLSL